MKQVEFTEAWGGHLLLPMVKGDRWTKQSDGKWKRSIWSVSDEVIQDALNDGVCHIVETV